MKYIKIFIVENVYSKAQRIFYFYVKDEMNHDISSQKTQIHKQKDEKEYSDTLKFSKNLHSSPPPPPPLPHFLLMEGNDLEKTLPVGTSNCPIFEGG